MKKIEKILQYKGLQKKIAWATWLHRETISNLTKWKTQNIENQELILKELKILWFIPQDMTVFELFK